MKTARDEGGGGYHPLHWLEHSYLQLGRTDEAAKLVAMVEDDLKKTSSPSARANLAMCRATFLVETLGAGPDSMMQLVDPSGMNMRSAFANHDLAIGLEFVRRNDLSSARQKLDSIRSRIASMQESKSNAAAASGYANISQSDVDTTAVMEKMLAAAIEFASGEKDKGVRDMISAAETEDKLTFEYGPPAIVKPAWEAAGELLLASGRKPEAAATFRKALKRYPNRRLSNDGLKAATTK